MKFIPFSCAADLATADASNSVVPADPASLINAHAIWTWWSKIRGLGFLFLGNCVLINLLSFLRYRINNKVSYRNRLCASICGRICKNCSHFV